MENTFEQFVEISNDAVNDEYKNKVYVDDASKTAVSTNGSIMVVRRDMYEQVKCTLKLLGSEVGHINTETNTLEKSDAKSVNLSTLLNSNTISSEYTRRFRIKLPSYLASFSKKKKHISVFFSLDKERPDISLLRGDYMLNAQLLSKMDLTQEYDFWFGKDGKSNVYVFPKGQDITNASCFFVLAPMVSSPDSPSITSI